MNKSFKITQNYAVDITLFEHYGSYGFSLCSLDVGGCLNGDHSPRFFIFFAIFNFVLFEIELYNINHEVQQ